MAISKPTALLLGVFLALEQTVLLWWLSAPHLSCMHFADSACLLLRPVSLLELLLLQGGLVTSVDDQTWGSRHSASSAVLAGRPLSIVAQSLRLAMHALLHHVVTEVYILSVPDIGSLDSGVGLAWCSDWPSEVLKRTDCNYRVITCLSNRICFTDASHCGLSRWEFAVVILSASTRRLPRSRLIQVVIICERRCSCKTGIAWLLCVNNSTFIVILVHLLVRY